jgi:nitrate/TMAO reductase-like tetraheme cytochrome c subunit
MTPRHLIVSGLALWALAVGFSARAQQGVAAAQPPAQAPAAASPANSDCLMCHEDDSSVRADGSPVVVKPAVFETSIHGPMSCVDCHADLAAATEFPHPEKLQKVDCSTCHSDTVDLFKQSVHATAQVRGSQEAPGCVSCHGAHDILPSSNPESRTYHLNIAATCSKCHGDPALTAKAGLPGDVAAKYGDSIHGRAVSRSGLTVAPTCSNCHGAHDIFSPSNPESRVAAAHVPETCGKCHEGIALKFNAGVHGTVLARGNTGAPACQTCHTAHAIQQSESTAWQLSVIGQCGTCHADRVATFKDTFHGQVTSLGSRAVAGCADCHGPHEILPASDPRSPIAPANLVKTCGKCHEGANENFVKYDPHANKHDRQRSPALYYVSKFMTVLLVGVFSFFGIHTTMWFAREIREGRRKPVQPPESEARAERGAAGDRPEGGGDGPSA